MNTGYLIYQAERPRTSVEQREIDAFHGTLAASLMRKLRSLAASLSTSRRAERHITPAAASCVRWNS